ncbi:MAG: hypothetical protein HOI53_04425 [Francisellaceae bacterium]|nr:hypothetical protein [Francisellaceae bacterium]
MGREWDSYWIPVRMVVGTLFSIPLSTGFNTMQYLVFKIVFSSILFANFLWTNVNYHIYSSGASIPAIYYQNNQKLATDFANLVVQKLLFGRMLISGESTSGIATYNKQLDDLIKSSSACVGVGGNTSCIETLKQLGQGGNYDYSVYQDLTDSKDQNKLNAIKLDGLKVKVSIASTTGAASLEASFPWVNDMASTIANNIYSGNTGKNCSVNGISCDNLIGEKDSITDYIVNKLTSGTDFSSSGQLYCPSIKSSVSGSDTPTAGFVDKASDCQYFSWWHANWHYIEIDQQFAKNSQKVNELIKDLDILVNGDIADQITGKVLSASGVFEQFAVDSTDLKPTTPVTGFGDAVSSALKDQNITDISFSSGVAGDFSSKEFEDAYNKSPPSGKPNSDKTLHLLQGLENPIYGNLKEYFSIYFNMNCKSSGSSCSQLFGESTVATDNYGRISAALEFLNQAGMLLPATSGSTSGSGTPQNYIPRANPMYYLQKSGLLGSIFNGLLVNKSPLFGSFSGDNSPTAHQHNTGGSGDDNDLWMETLTGSTRCNGDNCAALTQGLLGQIYQIGLLESSSGEGVYNNLLGKHFSMIQQVQTVGVNIISGVLNIMTGVYNDFMDKYKSIIDHATAESTTIQTKYLEWGWSGIGQAFVKSKEIKLQFGLLLGLAQISQSMMWLPILFFILTSLFTTGIMFAIIIPLTPYILFWAGKVAWLLLVLEALAAAPVVISVMIHPDGHKIWGYAEQAVKMLLNVFLMPALLIIGLLCGIVLTYVVIHFSAVGFHYISQEILGMANFASGSETNASITAAGIMSAFMIMMYATFITMAFNKCFSTIYVIPEKVLSWIGIQGTKFGEQESQEFKSSGQQMAKEGAQAGGQTMQQGMQAGEKIAQTATDRDFKSAEAYGGATRGGKQDLGEVAQGFRGGRGQ